MSHLLLLPGSSGGILADSGYVSSEPEIPTPLKQKYEDCSQPPAQPFSVLVSAVAFNLAFLQVLNPFFSSFYFASSTHGPTTSLLFKGLCKYFRLTLTNRDKLLLSQGPLL